MATQRSLEMLAIAADVIEEQGDDELAAILRQWSQGPELLVVWDLDPDPDLSYLDQEEFADTDPEDIISMQATVWQRAPWDTAPKIHLHPSVHGGWEVVASLGGIDFLVTDANVQTGSFTPDEAKQMLNDYQAEISKELLDEAGYE